MQQYGVYNLSGGRSRSAKMPPRATDHGDSSRSGGERREIGCSRSYTRAVGKLESGAHHRDARARRASDARGCQTVYYLTNTSWTAVVTVPPEKKTGIIHSEPSRR